RMSTTETYRKRTRRKMLSWRLRGNVWATASGELQNEIKNLTNFASRELANKNFLPLLELARRVLHGDTFICVQRMDFFCSTGSTSSAAEAAVAISAANLLRPRILVRKQTRISSHSLSSSRLACLGLRDEVCLRTMELYNCRVLFLPLSPTHSLSSTPSDKVRKALHICASREGTSYGKKGAKARSFADCRYVDCSGIRSPARDNNGRETTANDRVAEHCTCRRWFFLFFCFFCLPEAARRSTSSSWSLELFTLPPPSGRRISSMPSCVGSSRGAALAI
ncbi:unnamed protein product, partial [Trichogramma brassicae]